MPPGQIAALLGAVPLPLVLIGRDARIVALNAAAEALFGKAASGRPYVTVLRQPALLDCVEAALTTGAAQTAEVLTRETGRDATYRATATPVSGLEPGGVMLALEDVSQMQAAGEMRRDFVANVSHELRTPLTALLGFIETLRGPARDDVAARETFLDIMQAEARRMSRLVDGLLSLSRVEASERLRPAAQVDAAKVLRTAVATLHALIEQSGADLSLSGAEGPLMLPGDFDQLVQVLTNLIENAVKYGAKRVTVSLTALDRDPDLRGPSVRIEIADDGPGIDPLHVPRLTERFYRIDSHRSREVGGTGLGLAIVKHIVNRHRGRLRIDSALGQGSRFTVILPRATGG